MLTSVIKVASFRADVAFRFGKATSPFQKILDLSGWLHQIGVYRQNFKIINVLLCFCWFDVTLIVYVWAVSLVCTSVRVITF